LAPLSTFKKNWRFVTGLPDDFPLEARIFHAFSAVIIIAMGLATITNIALQLSQSAIMTGAAAVIQFVLYYISRFKGRFVVAATFSAIEINIITGIKYFYNAGISGPTLLTSVLSLYLIILVMPRRQWPLWVAINLLITFGICYA